MDSNDGARVGQITGAAGGAGAGGGATFMAARDKGPKGKKSDNRTVSFGDAGAVRSPIGWVVFGALFAVVTWFVTTRVSGYSPDFLATVDAGLSDRDLYRECQLSSACEIDELTNVISPLTFPSPADTFKASLTLFTDGYRNFTIWEHIWASLWRIIRGMFWGCLFGIPIGLAMGLSSKMRGFFDPMVEGFRVIPPLALVTLFGLMFGIGDSTAVPLLIFASIWIMIIAARAGVRNVPLPKVRAAYSLGASPVQLLSRVIVPNALPEIFTGLRVALGVSWGTLVAAELFGVQDGLGAMIQQAKNFSRLDVIVVGIVIIAIIGVAMDAIIRLLETVLIPWQGKG